MGEFWFIIKKFIAVIFFVGPCQLQDCLVTQILFVDYKERVPPVPPISIPESDDEEPSK